MNSTKALYANQDDHGGSAACAVISCFIAKHTLRWQEKPRRKQIDQIVREGAEAWQELKAGFLSIDQVLTALPEDLNMLRIRNSYHAMASGAMHDDEGHLLAHDARTVILDWVQLDDGSVAVVTRSAYTFTIISFDSIYYVVDSHSHVLQQRKSAIDQTQRLAAESDEITGALVEFYFPKDIADYVVNFIPPMALDPRFSVSSNEMDIDILELDKNTV